MLDAIAGKTPAQQPFTLEMTHECLDNVLKSEQLSTKHELHAKYGIGEFASIWDFIGTGIDFSRRMDKFPKPTPTERYNIWGIKSELMNINGANYWEFSQLPLASAETVADIEKFDWPKFEDLVFPELPANKDFEAWRHNKIVCDMSFIGPFGIPWMMRGMEQIMIDLYENPDIITAIVNKVEEFSLRGTEYLLQKYPAMIDYVGTGDDYGTQISLFVAPEQIKKFFMPSLKRHYDLARSYGAGGYHHSCGAIAPIIPELINAGVNILNPIQTTAAGMDPVKLKQDFGKKLCFHGGIDTQHTMNSDNPQVVADEVVQRIKQLGPNGYILGPSHLLQANVPVENIITLATCSKQL
jgi:uroporphyrinogen decarboxylase